MNTLFQSPLKKVKKIVYHIGDKVKIVNPEIFVRVGYPKTKQDIIEKEITDDEKRKVYDLLGFCFGEYLELYGKSLSVFDEIIDRLAYFKLEKQCFGGNERKVHTELKPEYIGKIAIVQKKRCVQTGTYRFGCSSYEDYEPPYLSDNKTHVILTLDILHQQGDCIFPVETIEIEECHVEKLV